MTTKNSDTPNDANRSPITVGSRQSRQVGQHRHRNRAGQDVDEGATDERDGVPR
jgi:hypothetical protein